MDDETYEAFKNESNNVVPLKRMGTSEEMARAIVFLAAEATYITGANIPADGGVLNNFVIPNFTPAKK